MIKYEWRDHLDPDESAELAAMLARAAAHDAEPEYNTIEYAAVEATLGQPDTRHLLIWRLPRTATSSLADTSDQIAGLLRLVFTSESEAELTVVIDPDARSIGILTTLLEQLGVGAGGSDGWAGTGARIVTAWSRGNHPAAGRASDRFLIPRVRRTWKLIRAAAADEATTAAPVLELLDSRTLADIGWAHGGAAEGTDVALREAGLDGIAIYVDSDDTTLVNACRLSGFQHDRTDVRYQLGDAI